MPTLKDWLTLGRPHTASLTIAGCLLGGLLAYARTHTTPNPWILLTVAAWAFAFHWLGFTDNNLCDLQADKQDPHKQHFPLVNGRIDPRNAVTAWAYGAGILTIGTMITAYTLNDPPLILAAATAILFGMAYNYASKRTLIAPLFIALSFAAIPAVGYFAITPDWHAPLLWFVAAYAFLLMLHEIAVFGYIKDLNTDKTNLLHRLGARAEPTEYGPDIYDYEIPLKVTIGAFMSRMLCVVLGAIIFAWLHPGLQATVPVLVGLVALSMTMSHGLAASAGPEKRSRKILSMSISEIFTYWLLILALAPLLGTTTALALTIFPLAWFILWNQYLWGTWIAPKV